MFLTFMRYFGNKQIPRETFLWRHTVSQHRTSVLKHFLLYLFGSFGSQLQRAGSRCIVRILLARASTSSLAVPCWLQSVWAQPLQHAGLRPAAREIREASTRDRTCAPYVGLASLCLAGRSCTAEPPEKPLMGYILAPKRNEVLDAC